MKKNTKKIKPYSKKRKAAQKVVMRILQWAFEGIIYYIFFVATVTTLLPALFTYMGELTGINADTATFGQVYGYWYFPCMFVMLLILVIELVCARKFHRFLTRGVDNALARTQSKVEAEAAQTCDDKK